MPPRPPHLPEFDEPPVVEVAISVQFETVQRLTAAHLGLLWGRFRARFPRTEERVPLEAVIERFPESPQPISALRLEATDRPPVPRLWFIGEGGDEMVQVQNDRFVKNWRKQGSLPYPRWKQIRPAFDKDLESFRSFLAENDLGPLRFTQCEVVYVNHIRSGAGWSGFGQVGSVLRGWAAPDGPGELADLRLHARYLIPDAGGLPVGRLHFDLAPGFTTNGEEMYVLQLTARGQSKDELGFLDLGHAAIVEGFDRLTTPEMHRVWKRRGHGGVSGADSV